MTMSVSFFSSAVVIGMCVVVVMIMIVIICLHLRVAAEDCPANSTKYAGFLDV